jgi:hypothetical protein
MPEFRVNSVMNGLRVAAEAGFLPVYPVELHCCTSFLLPAQKVPSIGNIWHLARVRRGLTQGQ